LRDEFGTEALLTIARGKNMNILACVLFTPNRQQVQITMYDYIHKILNKLLPDLDGGVTAPATIHLLSINQEAKD